MAEEATRSRLGRGLAALIGDVGAESSVERPRGQRQLPIGSLRPNARNPRRVFSDTELDELAASLRERGIIQPIVARPVRGVPDSYEIIAGERRWRAAQRAGLHEVPVVIIEATDAEALQLAIIENVQRTDLNPLEEAEGYRALIGRIQQQPGRDCQNHRQKPQPRRQHAAAAEAARSGQGAYINAGKLSRRPRPQLVGQPDAERLAERNRRPRPQRAPGRSDGARGGETERQGTNKRPQSARARGEKCRHARAGKTPSRCARACGQHRSIASRGGTLEHPLSQPRSARRGGAAAGGEAPILNSFPGCGAAR